MTLKEKYQFTLSHPSIGTANPINPISDNIVTQWVKKEGFSSYYQTVKDGLLLVGSDYQLCKTIFDSSQSCDSAIFGVNRICGASAQYFECTVKLTKSKWDFDNCSVELAFDTNDVHTCILQNFKKERNLLSALTSYTTYASEGYIEEFTAQPISFTSSSPFPTISFKNVTGLDGITTPTFTTNKHYGTEWSCLKSYVEFQSPTEMRVTTVWTRERIDNSTTQPNGLGWVSIGGNSWVRRLQIIAKNINNDTGQPIYQEEFYALGRKQERVFDYYDNGVKLKDAIEHLVQSCSMIVKSDLLGINPDNTYPSNIAYTAALQYYRNIFLYQKTDIKRPYVATNATLLNISIESLLGILGILNIKYAILDNVLRIEHISYFESYGNGIDFTVTQNNLISRSNNFTYIDNEIPEKETFSFQEKTDIYGGQFDGLDIEYTGVCNNTNDAKSYNFDKLVTNVSYVTALPENISNNGYCLVSTYEKAGKFYIWNNGNGINDVLGFKFLHPQMWRHGRFFSSCIINNGTVTALSSKRTKKQVIEVKANCSNIGFFDPMLLFRTGLGWCEVESMEHDAKTDTMKMNLLN